MRIPQAIFLAFILASTVISVPISGCGIQVAVALSSTPTHVDNAIATVQVLGVAKKGDAASVALLRTGDGSPQSQPIVNLTWKASPSIGVKYNVYRSGTKGECLKTKSNDCKKITPAPVTSTNYTDNAVQAGQSYFYVAKAVDSSGNESSPSNEAQAVISTPKK